MGFKLAHFNKSGHKHDVVCACNEDDFRSEFCYVL